LGTFLIVFVFFEHLIAFDEGERIPNLVLGVLCLTGRKIRDFLCSQRQISPHPEDFCRGRTRSAGNWYGLRPRFHDAQAPNGQFNVEANMEILLESIFEKFSSLPTRHSLKFTYKHKRSP